MFLQATRQIRRFQSVIYHTYIRQNSPLQVNLSHPTIQSAWNDIHCPSDGLSLADRVCTRVNLLRVVNVCVFRCSWCFSMFLTFVIAFMICDVCEMKAVPDFFANFMKAHNCKKEKAHNCMKETDMLRSTVFFLQFHRTHKKDDPPPNTNTAQKQGKE
jgi:hypothetical protein